MFSPLRQRENLHHKFAPVKRSSAMAQVPICWLQESEKQLYWAPQSACQFHQNVHMAAVSSLGVFWWCEDSIYIYEYNLQFCCIWWLLLCSCPSCCSCFLLALLMLIDQIAVPTPPTGPLWPPPSADFLTPGDVAKGQRFGMINWMWGSWIERFMQWEKDTEKNTVCQEKKCKSCKFTCSLEAILSELYVFNSLWSYGLIPNHLICN